MFLSGPTFSCPKNYVSFQDDCYGHNGSFCKECLKLNLELQLEAMAMKILDDMPDDKREEVLSRISYTPHYESKRKERKP